MTNWPCVEKVHSLNHINKLLQASNLLGEGKNSFDLYEENYENKHSFLAAKIAVDATITAIDALLNRKDHEQYLAKSYAVIRPPGHHAH